MATWEEMATDLSADAIASVAISILARFTTKDGTVQSYEASFWEIFRRLSSKITELNEQAKVNKEWEEQAVLERQKQDLIAVESQKLWEGTESQRMQGLDVNIYRKLEMAYSHGRLTKPVHELTDFELRYSMVGIGPKKIKIIRQFLADKSKIQTENA